ncbi:MULTISPECIES: IclR family transcriptional regulator [unclassified Variovorax]|uniref:IclR family transcriptional regulator n=1 Tax=unclassified Variovorax TaxID=663243 RepID=UPI0008C4142F|nr:MULTISPECIES: IclR family transcriptional regulator [unclassified Variovorax]SEJ87716.1 transcriptional regulator, IclR family [Variovorax sp. OK202]SFD03767.1 transcriptional regulator, IclR family [Variovorax sp. OK212]
MAANDTDRAQRGIQSIEVGGQLLRALVHHGRPMALKDLAREADMTPAKAHPYMVSFGRLGLIEQDRASGHYLLGPLALQLGLISLQQADPVHIATPLIAQLAQQIGHTVALAVWGARGATIVRTAESPSPVHVNMRHGTVFSLTNTASGRVFATYLDAEVVRRLLEEERQRQKQRKAEPPPPAGMPPVQPLPSWSDFQSQLREVRAHGISRSDGEVIEGVSAMAAPVFDHTGAIVLAVTAIGSAAIFNTAWDGEIARALKACADTVSQRLGAPAPTSPASPASPTSA